LARAMPGSGLGLAIVKQVVVKHGGMIRIGETFPGGQPPGTTFHVLLPGTPTGLMYQVPSAHSEITTANSDVDAFAGNASAVPSVISVDSQ
jgi:two-component system sensor histidine kinase MprB